MRRPALTEQEKHELHHRRIAETLEAYNAVPKRRSGVNDLDRRKRGNEAWWALTGHVRAMHDWHAGFFGLTYERVEKLHERLHEAHDRHA